MRRGATVGRRGTSVGPRRFDVPGPHGPQASYAPAGPRPAAGSHMPGRQCAQCAPPRPACPAPAPGWGAPPTKLHEGHGAKGVEQRLHHDAQREVHQAEVGVQHGLRGRRGRRVGGRTPGCRRGGARQASRQASPARAVPTPERCLPARARLVHNDPSSGGSAAASPSRLRSPAGRPGGGPAAAPGGPA